jgi:hypothetical protein
VKLIQNGIMMIENYFLIIHFLKQNSKIPLYLIILMYFFVFIILFLFFIIWKILLIKRMINHSFDSILFFKTCQYNTFFKCIVYNYRIAKQ